MRKEKLSCCPVFKCNIRCFVGFSKTSMTHKVTASLDNKYLNSQSHGFSMSSMHLFRNDFINTNDYLKFIGLLSVHLMYQTVGCSFYLLQLIFFSYGAIHHKSSLLYGLFQILILFF